MGIRRGDRSRYWRKMIAAQAKSGLPISKFCKREGLTESSFYQWRKKLAAAVAADAARMSPSTTMPATRFVPIELEPPVAAAFEVSFPNGCRLAVPSQFEESTLRRLVRLIGETIEC